MKCIYLLINILCINYLRSSSCNHRVADNYEKYEW